LCGNSPLLSDVSAFQFRAAQFCGGDSARDEAAIDAALQNAANALMANREGTIIVMDARAWSSRHR
jgi:hypothetical protein